jgi:hypothetical protein
MIGTLAAQQIVVGTNYFTGRKPASPRHFCVKVP